ncbi:uncharacterized protein AKAME5_002678600 [Lates japonicus]|uniref:Uncharacterized protein n=1 Tax=Lates japonicus TaxID=270547 RepID=A0AAD3RNY4_LATJO|nr:uncharacterized protein AKAME5_002678600 [Lates japonicus]
MDQRACGPRQRDLVELTLWGPLSQDETTEAPCHQALPLIFEPFEDVTPEALAGNAAFQQRPHWCSKRSPPPAAMAATVRPLSKWTWASVVETDSGGPWRSRPCTDARLERHLGRRPATPGTSGSWFRLFLAASEPRRKAVLIN